MHLGPLLKTPAALLLLAASWLGAAAAQPAKAPRCDELRPPSIAGATVVDVQTAERTNVTLSRTIRFCEVNVTLTHGTADDRVLISTWLPADDLWNGRFLGTGGGGYIAGRFAGELAPAIARGFAASSTDAGVGSANDGEFILKTDGSDQVNRDLLVNFAHRSIHEMTLTGKHLTRQYYGSKRRLYSYWTGCSTGGRQGMMEAQRYPTDYDGLMAAAPAINWATFVPAMDHTSLLRRRLGFQGPACELSEVRRLAVEACDALDGATDGVVAAPELCEFDAMSVVGRQFRCTGNDNGTDTNTGNETTSISAEAARIANEAWRGPSLEGKRVWYGYNYDSDLLTDAGLDPRFSKYAQAWTRLAVERDRSFDVDSQDEAAFASMLARSRHEYGELIDTSQADLSAAYRHGAKILTWHGGSDQAISGDGTVDYYTRVRRRMEREHGVDVDDFYRVFFAPGVGHCRGGVGALPDDALSQLVEWVEKGKAPERLDATTQDERKKKQPLCRLPTVARYDAAGDVRCVRSSWADKFEPLKL
ncbi:uncharacterized protein PFL1_06125 [Pseudozyma flocculosa PF-1]|uniref:Carboxylic ester hydrolase n=2 Tax=Pseudozyma flocculosa TaxID=84751 RepID=A0A5C3F6Z2_9BASI|nr:uncharacterized protein PFL1_06125 [Pseudozyma flocculosa PF-1]EPQ26189.1 hypothetical protein PFL1_06125 [Pseudozyma flocculosa PF-1]SPO40142.1 related to tannase precursor [Pseudozyma flocculosa]